MNATARFDFIVFIFLLNGFVMLKYHKLIEVHISYPRTLPLQGSP